jgi:hypothetical protein
MSGTRRLKTARILKTTPGPIPRVEVEITVQDDLDFEQLWMRGCYFPAAKFQYIDVAFRKLKEMTGHDLSKVAYIV